LLPPIRGDPSRGLASPAVQRPRPQAEPSRLQRFFRWRELPKQPHQSAPTASAVGPITRGGERRAGSNGNRNPADEPCPPGCSPLQGVLLRRLGADKRPKPFLPFDRERSLRFHSRAGFQGFGVRRKRLVSLETAGPPGVLHLFARSTSSDLQPFWLMVSPRRPRQARPRLRTAVGPTGVRYFSRRGA
jgi:hypothetical protein